MKESIWASITRSKALDKTAKMLIGLISLEFLGSAILGKEIIVVYFKWE